MNGNSRSTSSDEWPRSLDAMLAAPDHHTVLLENESVRVLDTRLAPGERTPVHTHALPSVLYILTWSDFIRYDADGTVLLDSRAFQSIPTSGMTLWSAPLGPHSAQNVGNQDLHVIAVELKSRDTSPGR